MELATLFNGTIVLGALAGGAILGAFATAAAMELAHRRTTNEREEWATAARDAGYRAGIAVGYEIADRVTEQRDNIIHLYQQAEDKARRWHHLYGHAKRVKPRRNGRAKLTEHQVTVARRRREAGETLTRLAAEYGVSKSTLSDAVNGKAWRHVA